MKKLDLIVVTLIPLIIFILVFFFDFQINYFTSLLLAFGIPSLYLSIKNKEKVKKVAFFSFLVSIPIAVIVELIAFGEKAWVVPESIFPFRLFGFSPIENYIWQFITVYTILIFYEYFCNNKFQKDMSKKMKIMIYILYPLTIIMVLMFYINQSLININYSYIWFGIIFFIIPITLFLTKYPKFFVPFLKVQIFFLYIHMIFELIGLKYNHWIYTGTNFVGWFSLFGLKMPIEELFFVMIIGAIAACTYYEYFANKNLK